MKNLLITILVAIATTANATTLTNRQIDVINASGGSNLSVPSTGANLISDTATQSLSNKTLSAPVLSGTVTGTYTLGGTPTIAGSAVSGNISGNAANITATTNATLTTLSALSLPGSQVSGAISGNAANITATSNSTLTTLSALSLPGAQVSGNISGNAANITATTNATLTTLSALSLPGSQVSGAISGNAANITATSNSTLTTLSALSLPGAQVSGNISGNAANVTGVVAIANGGTNNATLPVTAGGVIYSDGTKLQNVGAGSAGNVLQSNGASAPTWVSPSSGGASNVVATVGTPQSISAATAVAVTGQIVNGPNVVFVSGNGGAVTVTATPSITACTAAGEQLQLIGGANNVTLQDTASLAGSKLKLNGNLTLGTTAPASYTASFVCDAASGNWIELARY